MAKRDGECCNSNIFAIIIIILIVFVAVISYMGGWWGDAREGQTETRNPVHPHEVQKIKPKG